MRCLRSFSTRCVAHVAYRSQRKRIPGQWQAAEEKVIYSPLLLLCPPLARTCLSFLTLLLSWVTEDRPDSSQQLTDCQCCPSTSMSVSLLTAFPVKRIRFISVCICLRWVCVSIIKLGMNYLYFFFFWGAHRMFRRLGALCWTFFVQ